MASTTISILALITFLTVSASPSLALRHVPSVTASDKVSLVFYYESLCPYCSSFFVNHLAKIFDNGLIDIIDLKLSPWGNAKLTGNSTFSCQHGPSECLLDTIEACAIHVWPELTQHFPFIHCVETLVYNGKYPDWETCFPKLGLDKTSISSCYASGKGTELELKHAAETEALVPPHQYVPWVVVNGEPLYEYYEDFASYVCKAYKGTPLPNVCNNASLVSVLREKPGKNGSPVCYLEDVTAKSKPSLLNRNSINFRVWDALV